MIDRFAATIANSDINAAAPEPDELQYFVQVFSMFSDKANVVEICHTGGMPHIQLGKFFAAVICITKPVTRKIEHGNINFKGVERFNGGFQFLVVLTKIQNKTLNRMNLNE